MDVPFSLDLPEEQKNDEEDSDEDQMTIKEKSLETFP